jgi:hypothetical protein
MTKKTTKTKKMKKATAPVRLQSNEGVAIRLLKDYMNFGSRLVFRPEVRYLLSHGGGVFDTFYNTQLTSSKASFNGILRPDGTIEVGCQTFNAKTVKAIKAWANA